MFSYFNRIFNMGQQVIVLFQNTATFNKKFEKYPRLQVIALKLL